MYLDVRSDWLAYVDEIPARAGRGQRRRQS